MQARMPKTEFAKLLTSMVRGSGRAQEAKHLLALRDHPGQTDAASRNT